MRVWGVTTTPRETCPDCGRIIGLDSGGCFVRHYRPEDLGVPPSKRPGRRPCGGTGRFPDDVRDVAGHYGMPTT